MIALVIAAALTAPSIGGGPLITLADAKRVMAAAQADAARRNVSATLAIVDQYGELVLVQAAADARGGAVDQAVLQARSLVDDGSPALDDPHHHGGSSATGRAGAAAALLLSRGKVIGAIGDAGREAAAVAKAGAGAVR